MFVFNKNKINNSFIYKIKRKANRKELIDEKLKISDELNKQNKYSLQYIEEKKIVKISYNDMEMNSLDYGEAKENDNRTFFQYYLSLLRTNHILIFTFFQFGDYNSQSIKIYIFFYTFAINYLVSAMFYSDDIMHKILIDKGSFDFTYQLPQMFYSFIVSTALSIILDNLGLYEENIISFKNIKNKNRKRKKNFLFRIRCKIALFFILTFLLIIRIFLGIFRMLLCCL